MQRVILGDEITNDSMPLPQNKALSVLPSPACAIFYCQAPTREPVDIDRGVPRQDLRGKYRVKEKHHDGAVDFAYLCAEVGSAPLASLPLDTSTGTASFDDFIDFNCSSIDSWHVIKAPPSRRSQALRGTHSRPDSRCQGTTKSLTRPSELRCA